MAERFAGETMLLVVRLVRCAGLKSTACILLHCHSVRQTQVSDVIDCLLKVQPHHTRPADGMMIAGAPKHLYSPLPSTLILKCQSNDWEIELLNSIKIVLVGYFPICLFLLRLTYPSSQEGDKFWQIFAHIPLKHISWGIDSSKLWRDMNFLLFSF